MKVVQNITITAPDGTPMTDASGDVKLADGTSPVMTMEYLLKRILDISQYGNRSEMKKADAAYAKIQVTDDGKIYLEDADLEFLIQLKDKLEVFRKGRSFEVFHKTLEDAETVSLPKA
jgi:hypothetical protein